MLKPAIISASFEETSFSVTRPILFLKHIHTFGYQTCDSILFKLLKIDTNLVNRGLFAAFQIDTQTRLPLQNLGEEMYPAFRKLQDDISSPRRCTIHRLR